jgi:hypothetical protein
MLPWSISIAMRAYYREMAKSLEKQSQWTFEAITGARGLPSGAKVKVYNMQGRLVWMRQAGASATMSLSLKGAFLFQIIDGNDKVIYTGKMVIPYKRYAF